MEVAAVLEPADLIKQKAASARTGGASVAFREQVLEALDADLRRWVGERDKYSSGAGVSLNARSGR